MPSHAYPGACLAAGFPNGFWGVIRITERRLANEPHRPFTINQLATTWSCSGTAR